jgi:hypothetical protein
MSFHIMVRYIDGRAFCTNYTESLPSTEWQKIENDLAGDKNVSNYYSYSIEGDNTITSPVTYIAERVYPASEIDSIPHDILSENTRLELQVKDTNGCFLFKDRQNSWRLLRNSSTEHTCDTVVVNSKNEQLYPPIDHSR